MQQLNTQISVIYLHSNHCLQAAPWLSIVLMTWAICEEVQGKGGYGKGRPWGKVEQKGSRDHERGPGERGLAQPARHLSVHWP